MRKIIRFQEGGAMPAEAPMQQEAAPAQSGEDILMQIAQMMMEGLQNSDCQMLAEACSAFLQLLQSQGGQEPVGQPVEGQPVFKKGGKIVRRKKCGK